MISLAIHTSSYRYLKNQLTCDHKYFDDLTLAGYSLRYLYYHYYRYLLVTEGLHQGREL